MPARTTRRPRGPRARPDLLFRPSGAHWVLTDPAGTAAQTLSLTSALIWSYCDGTHDTGAIAAAVAEELPGAGDPADLREAVDATVNRWSSEGLLL